VPTIFYNSHATPDVYAIIQAAAPPGFNVLTLDSESDDERSAKLGTADVAIVASYPLRKPLIDAAVKLRLVQHQGVGWQDTVDAKALFARGIRLAMTPQGTTVGVAEHTILLMLAACKLLPHADSELRQGRFHINALRPYSRELSGRTIGYLGFGRIGQAVAERLRAFGCTAIYHDVALQGDPTRDHALAARSVGFDELLRQADVLSLHIPLTGQTRGLIGREALALMKPDAILINTARGGIVDEDALASALDEGRLAAAGLDVFAKEPPDRAHPLFALRNVVVTPHIAAGTRDALTTKMRAAFSNIERFFRGEPLEHEVIA
jgi:phosphoglycerate dehydrogenase-like enzyme